MTHGNKGEGSQQDHQHGAVVGLPQHAHGVKKNKEVMSKTPKTPIDQTGDPPKDMQYYAQKLTELPEHAGPSETDNVSEALDTEMVEGEESQGAAFIIAQTDNCPAEVKDETEEEEGEQLTLAEILRAVKKCTASVNNLQELEF